MPKCRTCGEEFTISTEESLSRSLTMDLLRVTRFRLGRLVGVKNGWLIGGIIIGLFALSIALSFEDIWVRGLSIFAFLVVVFFLTISLSKEARYSRIRSQNCQKCSSTIMAKQLLRPEELGPHKVAPARKKL